MKAVMLSIKPEWCEKIPSGKKTVEIRKTRPKLQTPFKCYIYCTKASKGWVHLGTGEQLDGKVIAEFICDKIIIVDCDSVGLFDRDTGEFIEKESCMNKGAFWSYTKCHCAYGWHISKLKVYDKPKALSDFKPYNRKECYFSDLGNAIPNCEDCHECKMTRPPQSWCYVEEGE